MILAFFRRSFLTQSVAAVLASLVFFGSMNVAEARRFSRQEFRNLAQGEFNYRRLWTPARAAKARAQLVAGREEIVKMGKAYPKAMAAEGLQTSIALLLASAIGAAQQQIHLLRLQGKNPGMAEIRDIAKILVDQILDSQTVMGGFLVSGTVGHFLKRPLEILGALASQGATRAILSKLLVEGVVGGIGAGVVNAVWETTKFWIDNARYLAREHGDLSEQSFKDSEGLFSLITDSALYVAGATDPDVVRRSQILGTVWYYMMQSLFVDEWRSAFLYDAWRHAIMSGDFVVLTTALAAATVGGAAVGTAFGPGVGTIVGMAFGFGAVIVAMNVPQEAKDLLTLELKAMRRNYNADFLKWNMARLWFNRKNQVKFEKVLANRVARRELTLNPYFEFSFMVRTRIQNLRSEVKILEQAIEAENAKILTPGQRAWRLFKDTFKDAMYSPMGPSITSGTFGIFGGSMSHMLALKKVDLQFYSALLKGCDSLAADFIQEEKQELFSLREAMERSAGSNPAIRETLALLKAHEDELESVDSWVQGVLIWASYPLDRKLSAANQAEVDSNRDYSLSMIQSWSRKGFEQKELKQQIEESAAAALAGPAPERKIPHPDLQLNIDTQF